MTQTPCTHPGHRVIVASETTVLLHCPHCGYCINGAPVTVEQIELCLIIDSLCKFLGGRGELPRDRRLL